MMKINSSFISVGVKLALDQSMYSLSSQKIENVMCLPWQKDLDEIFKL